MNQGSGGTQDTLDPRCPVALADWRIELEPPYRRRGHRVYRGALVEPRRVDGVVARGQVKMLGTFLDRATAQEGTDGVPAAGRIYIHQMPPLILEAREWAGDKSRQLCVAVTEFISPNAGTRRRGCGDSQGEH